jgi:prepilin-type N-terminal cleavage/methylation domain-containing protein
MNSATRNAAGRGQGGFTLLEMMVAVGVLGLVLLMAFSTMKSTTDISSMESIRNEMDRSGAEAMAKMSAELKSASILAMPADGSMLSFQIPVDLDGSGTVLDKDGDCEFGINELGVISNGSISYSFVQNTKGGNPEVLSEATLNRDLNNDGDKSDVFDRGRIERTSTAPAARTRVLSGVWVIQPSGNWGGDIDGDGNADPIFRTAGKQVWMDIWMVAIDSSGTAHLVRCRTSLHLRN